MQRTVAINGYVYDLGSDIGAQMAQEWIDTNQPETDDFENVFRGAQIVASPGGHHETPAGFPHCVFGGFSEYGNGYIPCPHVIFARPDGSEGAFYKDLPQLGTFRTSAEATDAARKAVAAEIRIDDSVVFECELS